MADAPSAVERLGTLCARTGFADIAPQAVERAKVSLVHNLAVALAGREREWVAHRMARELWSLPAQATLLHDGARVGVEAAAFANGALFHARSQDDTQSATTSHPGAPVTAAALAVAELTGATGAEFLTAVVLGYEVLGRLGRDVDHLLTARGFRAAAVLGVFGAAAATAKLLRLDAAQSAHALALAAQMPAGLSQVWVEGSADFPLQLGNAARGGVMAARAAALGATGARFALEGRGGFYRAYAGAEDVATEGFDAPAASWQVEDATVKPHPVCAILQGPLDALLALVRSHGLRVADIAAMELVLNPYEAHYPGIDNRGPFVSAVATKMSAQFSLALGLVDGRATPEGLARTADPAILALGKRVTVIADPAVEERLSRLTLRLADGRCVSGGIDAPVGRPSFGQIADFAQGLVAEIGADPAPMIAAVAALDTAPGVGTLVTACTRPGDQP